MQLIDGKISQFFIFQMIATVSRAASNVYSVVNIQLEDIILMNSVSRFKLAHYALMLIDIGRLDHYKLAVVRPTYSDDFHLRSL